MFSSSRLLVSKDDRNLSATPNPLLKEPAWLQAPDFTAQGGFSRGLGVSWGGHSQLKFFKTRTTRDYSSRCLIFPTPCRGRALYIIIDYQEGSVHVITSHSGQSTEVIKSIFYVIFYGKYPNTFSWKILSYNVKQVRATQLGTAHFSSVITIMKMKYFFSYNKQAAMLGMDRHSENNADGPTFYP